MSLFCMFTLLNQKLSILETSWLLTEDLVFVTVNVGITSRSTVWDINVIRLVKNDTFNFKLNKKIKYSGRIPLIEIKHAQVQKNMRNCMVNTTLVIWRSNMCRGHKTAGRCWDWDGIGIYLAATKRNQSLLGTFFLF